MHDAAAVRGPASIEELADALGRPRRAILPSIDRLERAGYARRVGARIDLTSHAREWIADLVAAANRRRAPPRQLRAAQSQLMSGFLARAREIQARQARTLRGWLEQPGTLRRSPHLRGGLSPAALRRVEVYVEAGLERRLPLAELAARAGLSVFHFARAFRVSTGLTPRAFVEARRIARARQLIADTRAARRHRPSTPASAARAG